MLQYILRLSLGVIFVIPESCIHWMVSENIHNPPWKVFCFTPSHASTLLLFTLMPLPPPPWNFHSPSLWTGSMDVSATVYFKKKFYTTWPTHWFNFCRTIPKPVSVKWRLLTANQGWNADWRWSKEIYHREILYCIWSCHITLSSSTREWLQRKPNINIILIQIKFLSLIYTMATLNTTFWTSLEPTAELHVDS